MNFLCICCKQRVAKDEKSRKPQLIEGAGIHDIGYILEWVEFKDEESALPINERQWLYTNQQPVIGDKRILRVKEPFDEEIGELFTTVFEPWQMYLNGWEYAESPEDISKACAVCCRFDEVLWADDFSAFIVVEIMNVIPLDKLYQVIPEHVTDQNFKDEFSKHDDVWVEYEDEHRLYRSWNEQGDIGQVQLIITDEGGICHEVMTSWYGIHDNLYYFGNAVYKPE